MARAPEDDDTSNPNPAHDLPRMARESAQQVWLAGENRVTKSSDFSFEIFLVFNQNGKASG